MQNNPTAAAIKRFESLVATTHDNVERTNIAAEYAALDQLRGDL